MVVVESTVVTRVRALRWRYDVVVTYVIMSRFFVMPIGLALLLTGAGRAAVDEPLAGARRLRSGRSRSGVPTSGSGGGGE
jgi:hypothetical protein